jgi:predicted RNA-binding Zn-ribbon protein involved in translation (DUF1610 family)
MIVRCYNCGLQGHKTQHCPKFGPRYPAPGKTRQDYVDEDDRIMGLFAADILAEHTEVDEDEEADRSRLGALKLGNREEAARQFACTTCGAAVGQRCQTNTGKPTSCHKDRYRRVEVELGGNHGNEQKSEGHLTRSATSTTGAGEATQDQ